MPIYRVLDVLLQDFRWDEEQSDEIMLGEEDVHKPTRRLL